MVQNRSHNILIKRFYSNKVNSKVIQMYVLGRLKLNKFVNCNNLVFLCKYVLHDQRECVVNELS